MGEKSSSDLSLVASTSSHLQTGSSSSKRSREKQATTGKKNKKRRIGGRFCNLVGLTQRNGRNISIIICPHTAHENFIFWTEGVERYPKKPSKPNRNWITMVKPKSEFNYSSDMESDIVHVLAGTKRRMPGTNGRHVEWTSTCASAGPPNSDVVQWVNQHFGAVIRTIYVPHVTQGVVKQQTGTSSKFWEKIFDYKQAYHAPDEEKRNHEPIEVVVDGNIIKEVPKLMWGNIDEKWLLAAYSTMAQIQQQDESCSVRDPDVQTLCFLLNDSNHCQWWLFERHLFFTYMGGQVIDQSSSSNFLHLCIPMGDASEQQRTRCKMLTKIVSKHFNHLFI